MKESESVREKERESVRETARISASCINCSSHKGPGEGHKAMSWARDTNIKRISHPIKTLRGEAGRVQQ